MSTPEHDRAPAASHDEGTSGQQTTDTTTIPPTDDIAGQADPLHLRLLAAGVPVIVCKPHAHRAGCADGCDRELDPPTGWATITADQARQRIGDYRPGIDTLAMVGGHGIDVLDVDAKAGASAEWVPDELRQWGCTITPSGGWHFPVPSTGYGKGDLHLGAHGYAGDYVGGTPAGGSRLLAFLPGSTRPKYPHGQYLEAVEWDIDRLLDTDPPDILLDICERSKLSRNSTPGKPAAPRAEVAAFLDQHADPTDCEHGRSRIAALIAKTADVIPGDQTRGRHNWAKAAAPEVVELVRAGCADTSHVHELGEALNRMKPGSDGEWWQLVAWALTNVTGTPDCPEHSWYAVNPWQPDTGQTGTGQSEDQDDIDRPNSWARTDLTTILNGTYVPEVAELLPRADGVGLLYRGRVHSIHYESEGGKSLLIQAEATRQLNAGEKVLYLDFESDAGSVVHRLLDLGADPAAIAARFDYRRPEVAPAMGSPEAAAWEELLHTGYALAVLDGVTEALDTLAPKSNGDPNERIAGWIKRYPKRLAQATGAAVVMIDHVPKSTDNRGRFAIGGQHKLAAIDGAAYTLDVREQPRRGHVGTVHLLIAKDRPGAIRPHCGPVRPDRTQLAAVVTIDGTGDGIAVTFDPPDHSETIAGRDQFRPTVLMERISTWMAEHPGDHSRTAVLDACTGKKNYLRTALDALADEGYVTVSEQHHGTLTHRYYTHARRFTEAEDAQTGPTGPGPVPTGPDRSHRSL